MSHVGFATAAALPIMCLFGVEISATDQIDLIRAQIAGKSCGETVYAGHGATPDQPGRPRGT